MGTRKQLMAALNDQSYVRLIRSPRHADPIDGFIVAVGEAWGVIQATLDGGYFDGYSAFRLKDVKKVRQRSEDFGRAYARSLPSWPPKSPPGLRLDSTKSVIESMAAASALVGIEQEKRVSALWIGELDEVGRKWAWLLEVRPDGSWHEAPLGYRTKKVTLVSIDSMYQQALSKVAGTSPTSSTRGH